MAEGQDHESRRGRRQGKRRGRQAEPIERPSRGVDYRQLRNPFPPMRVFSQDQVEHIHDTALRVLEELGMQVLLPRAREIFKAAGATVDDAEQMVRIDRGLVEQALRTAPGEILMTAGARDRDYTLGGDRVVFGSVAGAPHATDTDRGKRPGTLSDFRDLIRLSQHFDVIHFLGPSVEPQDVDNALRHLEMTRIQMTDSDKLPFVYARGTPQARDCFEMIKRARGLRDDDAMRAAVYCQTVINTNSPLTLDIPMANGIIDFAEMGQLLIITPFCLSGAMAPVTIAGALAQQHAEALAAITLGQLVRPGTPMLYGSFSSNVDMKSGAPAFGTPEHVKTSFGAGQLARHIGLAWRSAAGTASNIADAQATYETSASLWGAIMGGADMVIHGAGWLEGGLTASYEKFIIDIEMLQGFAEMFHPVPAMEDDIGFDAIKEVGPGGHYFAAAHTMSRYETAFYEPLVSDWRNFGQWTDGGAQTATQRANEIWKKTLADFEPPTLDEARGDAVRDYYERRVKEGGALPES
jgi:trimethylamine---corrinoid protein Co-methyltransferase